MEISSKQHRCTQFALVAVALAATIAGAIEIQSNSVDDAFAAFAHVNAADPPTLVSRHQAYREAKRIMGIDEGKALVAAAAAGQ